MAEQNGSTAASTSPGDLSSERVFLASSAFLFLASAAGTVYWCSSMSGGMVMPGGWTMSMTWMRMPGQTWAGAAVAFLAMWTLMMLAMMLPSLVPMLLRYRHGLRVANERRLGARTAICGAAYFFVWLALGPAAFALGEILAGVEMQWSALARAVPLLTGFVLLLAGCLQLTPWKARQLALCRLAPVCAGTPPGRPENAWRHGVRLGVHCALCCSGFMIILLVVGTMNLAAMAILAAAITIERMVPRPIVVARAMGVAIIVAGVVAISRALRAG
jgi:predicted metal-binding membrane protein